VPTRLAYRTESVKPWYLCFVLLNPSHPKLPRYLPRYKNASASKAHKVTALSYRVTFTFHYTTHIANPGDYVIALGCTKDTESKDGLGLPGHHGCGAKRISLLAPYFG
jgi:hypothetical protein